MYPGSGKLKPIKVLETLRSSAPLVLNQLSIPPAPVLILRLVQNHPPAIVDLLLGDDGSDVCRITVTTSVSPSSHRTLPSATYLSVAAR
jgi:hypothetical protein